MRQSPSPWANGAVEADQLLALSSTTKIGYQLNGLTLSREVAQVVVVGVVAISIEHAM